MKMAARHQALIELLDMVLAQYVPADRLLQNYFKARRYIGSQDRRYIKNTFYHILRQVPDLRNLLNQVDNSLDCNGRSIFIAAWHFDQYVIFDKTLTLDQIFNNQQYAPDVLSASEQQLSKKLSDDFSQQDLTPGLPMAIQSITSTYQNEFLQAYNQPAPLDLRVNTLKTNRDEVLRQLQQLSINASATPHSPLGIRLVNRISLEQFDFYKMGQVEIQDEGSQLAGYLSFMRPATKILDLCAGSGGKTLQLAALMNNQGTLVATDISAQRIDHCQSRLQHAGITNVVTKAYDDVFQAQYDSVLIDAPCSGSGTWRRHPELKIHLTVDKLQHYTTIQSELLSKSADLVPVGGTIVYLTCSFLTNENEQQIDKFLAVHPNFAIIPSSEWTHDFLKIYATENYLKLSPSSSNTDGFFGAVLIKKF